MIKTVLPDKASFQIDRHKGDRCSFTYRETFKKEHKAAVLAAAKVLERLLPKSIKMVRLRNGFVLRGRDIHYNMAAGFIVSEFFGWTDIGETKLRDLMAAATVAQAAVNQGFLNEAPKGIVSTALSRKTSRHRALPATPSRRPSTRRRKRLKK